MELLLDLVRVKLTGLLLVGLVDVIETGGLADAEELVKGDVGALMGNELVADSEDFAVCVVQDYVRMGRPLLYTFMYGPPPSSPIPACVVQGSPAHLLAQGSFETVGRVGDLPSLDHAAVSGVNKAKRPRDSAENLMIALFSGLEQ